MKLPKTYLDLLTKWEFPGQGLIEPVPDYSVVYPPVGFLAWPIRDIGNGDYFGYYWPIGRENADPVVAMMSHDCWTLNPIASSIEALARMRNCRDLASLSQAGEADDDGEEKDEPTKSIAERLVLDESSPYLLVANADAALAEADQDRAERLYLKAVDMLPEYTAAHYGLVVLYRRTRKTEQALRSMLDAIRCPLCFWGASFWGDTHLPDETVKRSDYRRKSLHWLQQTRSEQAAAVSDDPLFQARHRLTFASGVKTNDGFLVYEEVIEKYVEAGKPVEAIQLAMVYGELMMCETASFRERSGFTPESHRQRLLRLFRAGGFEARTEFLEQAK